MLASVFKKIFGDNSTKFIKKYSHITTKVSQLEEELTKLSDDELKNYSAELKNKVINGLSIDNEDIISEAFALIRESGKRNLKIRCFDVQIMGGLALHFGNISEMQTGEGKTLVATLAAYLNALTGKGVHIVTVNDYLTKRDREWMGPVFELLGMTVGCVTDEISLSEKIIQYNCDITYVNNSTLGFDYLRDNMRDLHQPPLFHRGFNFVIVDEADSILIDEARTPLIISGPSAQSVDAYGKINLAVSNLKSDCYVINEEEKSVHLTDIGVDNIEKTLKSYGIIKDDLYSDKNFSIVNNVNQALKARLLFHKNKDYLVKDKKVLIIDEFTGRILDGRRYSEGLHQAIEAKENVPVQKENQTLASITYQNLFRMYHKLSGMTGTAQTEAQEFADIYHINVISIPTNKKVARLDNDDLVFMTKQDKYNFLIKTIKDANERGQPVLLGTASVESSEEISKIFKKNNIKHEVLNAKHHDKEAHIIANSGRSSAVTIATNMAGRGTDIKLGGNVDIMLENIIENAKNTINIDEMRQEISGKCEIDKNKVLEAGGLMVIGTERHESRRIDNQLRGRSGRQGDPGETIFLLSLEDDLLRIFGGDRIKSIISKLGYKEGEAMNHTMLTKVIRYSQKRIESANYDIRKNLLRYDDILNEQRIYLYSKRSQIIKSEDLMEQVQHSCMELAQHIFENSDINPGQNALVNQIFINKVNEILGGDYLDGIPDTDERFFKSELIGQFIFEICKKKIDIDIQNHDKDSINAVLGTIILGTLDEVWRSHLSTMASIRDGIHLRSYGQKDPLNEYKLESYKNFDHIMQIFNSMVVNRVNLFQLHS